jgi:hypothetical protein
MPSIVCVGPRSATQSIERQVFGNFPASVVGAFRSINIVKSAALRRDNILTPKRLALLA